MSKRFALAHTGAGSASSKRAKHGADVDTLAGALASMSLNSKFAASALRGASAAVEDATDLMTKRARAAVDEHVAGAAAVTRFLDATHARNLRDARAHTVRLHKQADDVDSAADTSMRQLRALAKLTTCVGVLDELQCMADNLARTRVTLPAQFLPPRTVVPPPDSISLHALGFATLVPNAADTRFAMKLRVHFGYIEARIFDNAARPPVLLPLLGDFQFALSWRKQVLNTHKYAKLAAFNALPLSSQRDTAGDASTSSVGALLYPGDSSFDSTLIKVLSTRVVGDGTRQSPERFIVDYYPWLDAKPAAGKHYARVVWPADLRVTATSMSGLHTCSATVDALNEDMFLDALDFRVVAESRLGVMRPKDAKTLYLDERTADQADFDASAAATGFQRMFKPNTELEIERRQEMRVLESVREAGQLHRRCLAKHSSGLRIKGLHGITEHWATLEKIKVEDVVETPLGVKVKSLRPEQGRPYESGPEITAESTVANAFMQELLNA